MAKSHKNKYDPAMIPMLKERLAYDPIEGTFTWIVRSGRQAAGTKGGTAGGNGYRYITLDGHHYFAHRVAWAMYYGFWPTDQIDDINHIRDDNRIANLREVTGAENSRNTLVRKKSRSGVLGVHANLQNGYFQAYIRLNGKKKHLGWYKSVDAAREARERASKENGFHENHGKGSAFYSHSRDKNKNNETDPRQLEITEK